MATVDDNSPDKIYVDVIEMTTDAGQCRPLYFKWLDGEWKKVYEITARDREHSRKAGGIGERFAFITLVKDDEESERQGKDVFRRVPSCMWWDEERWFMERQRL